MAQQAQPANPMHRDLAPERSAWLILLFFFALFCAIVAATAYLGQRYYTTAMVPVGASLVRSHVNTGVVLQTRDRLAPESIERLPPERDPCRGELDICGYIHEGESIRTRREAGYGPVASLVLPDESHIQLWASPTGADLTLQRYQVTQWTKQRQEVVLRQQSGYARYDITQGQPYDTVDYAVEVDDSVRILLAPGGSYSVYVPYEEQGHQAALTRDGKLMRVEVAVRSGNATIIHDQQQIVVRAGELTQVDTTGHVGIPTDAYWELIADGDFTQYKQQNEYLPGSQTWERLWNENNVPGLSDTEKNGRFLVVKACRPETPDLCSADEQVYIGQFRRDGGQTRPFTIGIQQSLDVDVSEYPSLRLSGWVRVLNQSIPGAGVQGSECPIMIQLTYKPTSPTDQQQDRYFCVYTAEGDTKTSIPDAGEIRYRPVPAYTWYRLDIELRDDTLIREARYLQMIRIEARGHDYLAELSGVSLIGKQ